MIVSAHKALGAEHTELHFFDTWDEYHSATFNPDVWESEVFFTDFRIRGKSYAERKANAEQIAIDWSNAVGLIDKMYYSDLAVMGDFFERIGRRYGLMGVFCENAIC